MQGVIHGRAGAANTQNIDHALIDCLVTRQTHVDARAPPALSCDVAIGIT